MEIEQIQEVLKLLGIARKLAGLGPIEYLPVLETREENVQAMLPRGGVITSLGTWRLPQNSITGRLVKCAWFLVGYPCKQELEQDTLVIHLPAPIREYIVGGTSASAASAQ